MWSSFSRSLVKVLIVHNAYQFRSGKHTGVDGEPGLLKTLGDVSQSGRAST